MNPTTAEDPQARRTALRDSEFARLQRMVEIRLVEDRIGELFARGEVRGTTHLCQGQEAVAVGVAATTRAGDTVTCTYRGHGMALALGLTPSAVMGEILGRTTGCISGMGGSMHMSDPDVGLMPTFAVVGAGLPVAVGAGLSSVYRGEDSVAIAVFGDGATNIGAFHESLNLAAVWGLPVVFLCENNLYGEYSPIRSTTPIDDLAGRAGSYGIPGDIVDGQSIPAVMGALDVAIERARHGDGPTLIEAKTYRYSGHSRSDPASYRPAGELELWRARDPILLERDRLLASGALDETAWNRLNSETTALVDRAMSEAKSAPEPDASLLLEYLYSPTSSSAV